MSENIYIEPAKKSYAELAFAHQMAEANMESALLELLEEDNEGQADFSGFRYDYYDRSIEIDGAPPKMRLDEKTVTFLLDECDFNVVYVNHTDGWETHYRRGNRSGWRRRQ